MSSLMGPYSQLQLARQAKALDPESTSAAAQAPFGQQEISA